MKTSKPKTPPPTEAVAALPERTGDGRSINFHSKYSIPPSKARALENAEHATREFARSANRREAAARWRIAVRQFIYADNLERACSDGAAIAEDMAARIAAGRYTDIGLAATQTFLAIQLAIGDHVYFGCEVPQ
jgi:hypothetical protein